MADLLEYLEWRGDISFADLKPCEADYAILGCISYLPYDKLVAKGMNCRPVSAAKVFEKILTLCGPKGDGRQYHLKEDEALVKKLCDSPRFSELQLVGFENIIDEEKEMQFAAITVLMPNDELIVLYRGTDRSLVGWKEDFHMAFDYAIPSHKEAVRYIELVAKTFKRRMCVCGHSKGGNLAMYASAFCSSDTQALINEIINLDGPGFYSETASGNDIKKIVGRLRTYLPQMSIAGLLLEHNEISTVVHSSKGFFSQHSPHSWEVRRGQFVREEGIRAISHNIDGSIKTWISNCTMEQRGRLVEGYWRAIMETGAKKVEELFTLKNILSMLKNVTSIDDDTKELMGESLKVLYKAFIRVNSEAKREQREARKKGRKSK
ncbi:MAG: DUF2974 domain-containing protein [Lachnospiraceae bacterium]|nr:DUF2974 domain-containing protein [Lachnospiraceae bacterium]